MEMMHNAPFDAAGPYLTLDETAFAGSFPGRPFLIGHRLAGHPLLTLPALRALAGRLPREHIEYAASDIPVNMGTRRAPLPPLSPLEALERIEESRSWMILKWTEVDPAYRELLNGCLDEIQRLSEGAAPGMTKRHAFIVISSPRSVTPYHIDHEHNFLLHVRGDKHVSVFDPDDRQVLSERDIERFYSGAHRNLEFRPEYQARATEVSLRPGQGLHFPVNAPHHLRTGDDVCISFSVTFQTPAVQRRAAVYALNGRLRRLGLAPVPYGRSALRDSAKGYASQLLDRAGRLVAQP